MSRQTLVQIGREINSSKWEGHSYLPIYEKLFAPWRDEPINFCEIGIAAGNSLYLWLQYFTKATIFGIDSAPYQSFHPRLRVFQYNQEDPNLAYLFQPGVLQIVIDDAGYDPKAQRSCQHHLWNALAPGGLYLVEDCNPLPPGTFNKEVEEAGLGHPLWKALLHPWSLLPGYEVFANFRTGLGAYRNDDVLILVRKPS